MLLNTCRRLFFILSCLASNINTDAFHISHLSLPSRDMNSKHGIKMKRIFKKKGNWDTLLSHNMGSRKETLLCNCRNGFGQIGRNTNTLKHQRRRWHTSSLNQNLNLRLLSSTIPSSKIHDNHGSKLLEDIFQELKQLSQEILEHDELYYTPGSIPQISDDEYDAFAKREADICQLYPQLQKRLEEESGLGSKATRYGGRVGPLIKGDDYKIETTMVTRTAKEKILHLENAPMQSLDNAMISTDVVKWLNRMRRILMKDAYDAKSENETKEIVTDVDIIAEPKLDGLSLSLRYQMEEYNGSTVYRLISGATRGDGVKGEDVTDAVMELTLDNGNQGMIPLNFTLNYHDTQNPKEVYRPKIIEVRGEVILPTTTFQKLTEDANKASADIGKNDTKRSKSLIPLQFSNARNAASGILLRRKAESDLGSEEREQTKSLRRNLRFYAYAIVFSDELKQHSVENHYRSGKQLQDLLGSIGFSLPHPSIVTPITFSTVREVTEADCQVLMSYHEKVMNSREIDSSSNDLLFDFDVDGIVYKISLISDRNILGSSSRYPRWAIAHKFPASCAVTTLRGVEVQVGRTGALTPVAILDPVELGGVVVSRASLHNFQFAQSILEAEEAHDESGHIDYRIASGSSVMISRAGDVIPQVLRRVRKVDENDSDIPLNDFISLCHPNVCPACGAPTYFDVVNSKPSKNATNDFTNETVTSLNGQVMRCGGPQLLCPPRAIGALSHAFSRDGLDIVGLSEGRLQQLMNASLIHIPADLFKVVVPNNTIVDQITEIPLWGEKSTQNLVEATRKVASNGISLSRYIYSLGIRHVGLYSSKLVASAYGSVSNFFNEVDLVGDLDPNEDHFENVKVFQTLRGDEGSDGVKGVGPTMIKSLIQFSHNKKLVYAAKELAKQVNIHDEIATHQAIDTNVESKPFIGKSVVFTGCVGSGMSRSTAQRYSIEILGAASTPSSISKSTGIVVVGTGGGKKAKDAEKMGIPIMNTEDFLELLKDRI